MAIFNGDDFSNHVNGGGENNVIRGLGGDDRLFGRLGDDEIRGGAGLDEITGNAGADRLYGDSENDIIWADQLDTVIDGGLGLDRVWFDFRHLSRDWSLSLIDPAVAQAAHGMTLVNLEHIYFVGGRGDDEITGGSSWDHIEGGSGNDILRGGAETDQLYGDVGADTLLGGDWFDYLVADLDDILIDGGADRDTLRLDASAMTGALVFSLSDPSVTKRTIGATIIRNIETFDLVGTRFDDVVSGGAGNDSFEGGWQRSLPRRGRVRFTRGRLRG